jgi:hypothetical protein
MRIGTLNGTTDTKTKMVAGSNRVIYLPMDSVVADMSTSGREYEDYGGVQRRQ